MKKFIKYGALLAIVGMPNLAVAASPSSFTTAIEPGQCQAVTKTPEVAVPARMKNAWCIKAKSTNTDRINFTLDSTASPTVGADLGPGETWCDPVAAGTVYTGVVYVAAVTTAGTVTYCTVVY